jgi:hypothetical protein
LPGHVELNFAAQFEHPLPCPDRSHLLERRTYRVGLICAETSLRPSEIVGRHFDGDFAHLGHAV